MILIQIQYQNTKPSTIILNIMSALLLTQYAENTYPLTFQSNKSAPSVSGLGFISPPYTLLKGIHRVPSISTHQKAVLFWHLYISQNYTLGMPKIPYHIVMNVSPTPFFATGKLFVSLEIKMALHKFFIIGCILLEKNPVSLTFQCDLRVISNIK